MKSIKKIKTTIKKAVDSALKGTKKVRKGTKIVNAIELTTEEREVMFRDELNTLMTKYGCGLSIVVSDQKSAPLPVIEA